MIGDQELPAEARSRIDSEDVFEEKGFMFFRVRQFGGHDDFENDTDFEFEGDVLLAEGEIDAGGGRVEYRSQLGTSFAGDRPIPSIAAELKIDCDDGYHRFGVWFLRTEVGEDEEDAEVEAGADDTEVASAQAEPIEPVEPVEEVEEVERAEAEAADEASGEWLADAVERDYAGTPADPEALRAFLDHFDLCR